MKKFSHLCNYLAKFFLEWKMFQIKVVEKIKIHILFSVKIYQKSYLLWDNVEKHCEIRQAAHGNMAERCILD
jgi:hypothetical protein